MLKLWKTEETICFILKKAGEKDKDKF